jgi:phosphohistidine phosphatase
MTTLLLIRHGIAEDLLPGQRDADRALTAEGWKKSRAAMKGLAALGYVPTRGFSSPYRRALETLVCLQEATGAFPTETRADLTPEGRPAHVEMWLRGLAAGGMGGEILALVSHQPFLGELVFHLTGRHVEVKKASCSVIRWQGSAWRLERHYQPSELRH